MIFHCFSIYKHKLKMIKLKCIESSGFMKYDLIVVGMGPSAAFLAYELIQLNNYKNVLLIDQGKEFEKR